MNCTGEICHVSSKRIRVNIPAGKRNKPLMSQLGKRLEELPAVANVKANPRTGSLVICHNCQEDEVLSILEENPGIPLELRYRERPPVLSKQIKTKVRRGMHKANKKMTTLSGGSLDFPSVLGLSLVGMAFYQMRQGLFLPAGLTMMILAYKAFDEGK